MKKKTIILFIIGAIFVIGLPSYDGVGATIVGIALAALCFYFGYRSMKKPTPTVANSSEKPAPTVTNSPENNPTPAVPTSAPAPQEEKYEFLHIKLAGVTFKNGKKSRQTILRAIKFRDGEFAEGVDLELVPYEWEGQPAYGIYANNQQIGNVPANKVEYISENFDRIIGFTAIEVYGGGRNADGSTKSYGCEVVLKLNNNI